MDADAAVFLAKAGENLLSAESEFANGRYNSCANRCYYACFQAAVAALLREGIRPARNWGHAFVQSQFSGVLIDRRKRYPGDLRRVLADTRDLRETADYQPEFVAQAKAGRALARSRAFVEAVKREASGDRDRS